MAAIKYMATVTRQGQATIPVRLREILGVRDGGPIMFVNDGDTITVKAARKPSLSELLDGFDSAVHRHPAGERVWDDDPQGGESL